MARRPRLCIPGIPVHLIQRGNNRQACFASTQDMAAYAAWLREYSVKYHVSIHAWVFMANHVHLLVTPETHNGISSMMRDLGQRYVRYFNYVYQRTGTLWEGRYKSCIVDEDRYLLTCQRYIELNPVRAGIVRSPSDYHWSSYRAHATGNINTLHTPHRQYMNLSVDDETRQRNYRSLFEAQVDTEDLILIRDATNKELALGSEKFKDKIESLTGRRVKELKRGPKQDLEEFLL